MLLAWSSEWPEPWARRPLAATPPTPIATAPNATPRRMRTWFVKLGLIGLLLGLSLVIETDRAHACICGGPRPTPLEAAADADIVFSGTVVSRSDDSEATLVTRLRVDAVWKGPSETTIVIKQTGTSCAADFSGGRAYLVYAYKASGGWGIPSWTPWNDWTTSNCTRTMPLHLAQDDIDALDALANDTDFSPWGVGLLVAGALALAAVGIVTIRRRSENPRP